jgi:hypothetical protein
MDDKPDNTDPEAARRQLAQRNEEILRQPTQALRNRNALRTLFGPDADIERHIKAMIAKTRWLPYIAENPDLAPWEYARKLDVHRRQLAGMRDPQEVFFHAPQDVPKESIRQGGKTVDIPTFLQLNFYNRGSGPTAMHRYVYRCIPSATTAEIKRSTQAELDRAIKTEQTAMKAKKAAKAATQPAPKPPVTEPAQEPPKAIPQAPPKEPAQEPSKDTPQTPAPEPTPPPRDTKKGVRKKKKSGNDDQLNLF